MDRSVYQGSLPSMFIRVCSWERVTKEEEEEEQEEEEQEEEEEEQEEQEEGGGGGGGYDGKEYRQR